MGAGAEGGEYSRAMRRDRLAAVERAHSFPAKVNKVLSDPPRTEANLRIFRFLAAARRIAARDARYPAHLTGQSLHALNALSNDGGHSAVPTPKHQCQVQPP